MVFDSPNILYGVASALYFYDVLWQILWGIGLIQFALVFAVGKLLSDIFFATQGDVDVSRLGTLIITKVAITLGVVSLFCVPLKTLDTTAMNYRSACNISHTTNKAFGKTGTTLDATVGNDISFTDIKVPLGLYFFLSFSSSLSFAVQSAIPCDSDIKDMAGVITTAGMPTALRGELNNFESECYIPSKNAYLNEMNNAPQVRKDELAKTLKRYGGTGDVNWIGSELLQSQYYPNFYTKEPVSAFPYDKYKNPQYAGMVKNGTISAPNGGFPNCSQWWGDSTYGIRARLYKILSNQYNRLGVDALSSGVQYYANRLKDMFSYKFGYTTQDNDYINLAQDGLIRSYIVSD